MHKKVEEFHDRVPATKPKKKSEEEPPQDSKLLKKMEKDNQFLMKKLYDLHKKYTKMEKENEKLRLQVMNFQDRQYITSQPRNLPIKDQEISKFVASSRLKEDNSQKYQIPPLKTLEVPIHIQEYFEMIKNSQID